jgi:hypothetical protein
VQTLAFMAGVIFGGIAALPIGAVIGWAVRSPRQAERAYHQTPPTVIMTPPSYQVPEAMKYPAPQQVVSAAPGARREFTTIGEEEIVYHESESVW